MKWVQDEYNCWSLVNWHIEANDREEGIYDVFCGLHHLAASFKSLDEAKAYIEACVKAGIN